MRTQRPKICIAHQTVWAGDAIGNDIVGAYNVLTQCGYDAAILCQYVHPDVQSNCWVIAGPEAMRAASDFDMLLYHHSIHWPHGEDLIRSFRGPVVVKYHNITPADYFAGHAPHHSDKCREGRLQTARLAAMPGISIWQADSTYNASELREAGVKPDRCDVVPPFNRVDELARKSHTIEYPRGGPFTALFVGRRAPNKGHRHLVRTLAAWRDLFPEVELRCRVVGSTDSSLASYYRELQQLEQSLGTAGCIEWMEHVSNGDLEEVFRTSHVYLNLSEHEGFCVPLIEAQALGLPVVSTNATAMGETAGAHQVVVPVPRTLAEYDLIAGLVHEICVSPAERERLVQAGFANVFQRFTSQAVEARFLESLAPVLEKLEA